MTRLPNLSSRECIAALEKAGFYVDRQRGSHFIMYRDEPAAKVVVPMRKTLAKGTLRAIIRDAGMTVAEFVALLSSGAPLATRLAWRVFRLTARDDLSPNLHIETRQRVLSGGLQGLSTVL